MYPYEIYGEIVAIGTNVEVEQSHTVSCQCFCPNKHPEKQRDIAVILRKSSHDGSYYKTCRDRYVKINVLCFP